MRSIILTLTIVTLCSQIEQVLGNKVDLGSKNRFACTQNTETKEFSCTTVSNNEKFLTQQVVTSQTQMTTTGNSTIEEVENEIESLSWYTLALILIFVLQILICCGMVMWTKNKIKSMKKEQERQSDEFYKFLYSFNKMMKLEEEQMNVIMQQPDGRTPK